MSESSYKLIPISRRLPTQKRRRRVRKVIKQVAKPTNQILSRQKRPSQKKSLPSVISAVPKKQRRVVSPTKTQIISHPSSTANRPVVKGKIPPWQPNSTNTKIVRMPKQPLPRKIITRRSKGKPMARTLLYIVRLLILGVGIGAIVGTVLSMLDPANRISTSDASNPVISGQVRPQPTPTTAATGLMLSQEITPLKGLIQNLIAQYPSLTPGVFVLDLDNGNYVDINSSTTFSAASTIKLPILIAFFQDVDAGKISLDEQLVMSKQMVAGGSGNMQYKPVGSKFTALETVTNMITISDNTATNMLISRLGGIEALNQRFASWGLTATKIHNLLPDLQGTNTTSAKELGTLIAMVNKGNLVSSSSRDRILNIMQQSTRKDLLPSGLDPGATIADKTGDIGTALADAGLISLPNGKHYIAAVMVQRPYNDASAQKLISSISRAIDQNLSQNVPTAIPPTVGYQPPLITTPGINGYQAPVIAPPIGGDVNNYQSPVIPPPVTNTLPMTGYPSPVTPQYYYPEQR